MTVQNKSRTRTLSTVMPRFISSPPGQMTFLVHVEHLANRDHIVTMAMSERTKLLLRYANKPQRKKKKKKKKREIDRQRGERQRHRETETERQTDRQTDRQRVVSSRYKQTNKQRKE